MMTGGSDSLRILDGVSPIYLLPGDDLVGEVLIPGLARTSRYDCMMGFFTSNALRELAPGLAPFLARRSGTMRLMVSPNLSGPDRSAIEQGLTNPAPLLLEALMRACGDAEVTADALSLHTLACLAYLISARRLELRLVVVRDGLFHPKVWLLEESGDRVVVHGSNNLTFKGLQINVEQVSVSRSWRGGEALQTIERLDHFFADLWAGDAGDNILVFDFPEAVKARILSDFGTEEAPSTDDYWAAAVAAKQAKTTRVSESNPAAVKSGQRFSIPDHLRTPSAEFAHQDQGIARWEEAGRRGILEMATGSGKTITALKCAHRLYASEESKPLLVVVAAPFLPLINQWDREATNFGLRPVVPGNSGSRSAKFAAVSAALRRLTMGIESTQCIVVTHDFLCDPEFAEALARASCRTLLVADEVHNLGTARFLSRAVDFQYRLGLSATPDRQYDGVGTAGLRDYFGSVVFRFTLAEAIGKCLVPYRYHVHEVPLTNSEFEEWGSLTKELRTVGWRGDAGEGPDPYVTKLLMERKRVLEHATNKLGAFEQVFSQEERTTLRHTLVYASDKGREQLLSINALLMNKYGVRVHQLTAEETASGISEYLMNDFVKGVGIQVLTAMRVLDEGVDIPEIDRAYILASTTAERQWIQRRGRVLRISKRTNKPFATIHDFVVVPPLGLPASVARSEMAAILKGELTRASAFATLATNAGSEEGAISAITRLIGTYL